VGKKSSNVIFLIILIAGVLLTNTASAQTRVPGVSVGNSFKYTFDFEMNVSSSSFNLPDLLDELISQVKNIDSVSITVTQVSGSVVTMQTAIQFKNNTQQSTSNSFDIANGPNTSQEGTIGLFLVAANLSSGDQIYVGSDSGAINETVTRAYLSDSRLVNHQRTVMNYNVSSEELEGTGITNALQQSNTQDTYWDKQTGVLVEMNYSLVTRSEQINADIALNFQIVESNVFNVENPTIPEFSSTTMVVLALAVSALVTTVCCKGLKRKESCGLHFFSTSNSRKGQN
jgi:hypothetical protein